jgi:hypothetical protein
MRQRAGIHPLDTGRLVTGHDQPRIEPLNPVGILVRFSWDVTCEYAPAPNEGQHGLRQWSRSTDNSGYSGESSELPVRR